MAPRETQLVAMQVSNHELSTMRSCLLPIYVVTWLHAVGENLCGKEGRHFLRGQNDQTEIKKENENRRREERLGCASLLKKISTWVH